MKTPWPHQRLAIDKLTNGSVLVAPPGSGKSLVGLYYYYETVLPRSLDIYVITTAMKRDRLDWQREATAFGVSSERNSSVNRVKMVVDSWNNIKKYTAIKNAFFIFDEQKTMNYGVWSKSFISIARSNEWVLVTATPADRWIDLMSVFIARGIYKNKSDFVTQHVVYNPYVKYPSIKRYINTDKLKRAKKSVFVVMDYVLPALMKDIVVAVEHDATKLKEIERKEWNPFKDMPIKNLAEYTYVLRRILNSDPSRIEAVKKIRSTAKKLIIFYSFDFELDILRSGFKNITVAEHNGHKHDPLPIGNEWVYLVQYNSGNEAWECFTTNHMLFYSLNYSFRIITQAKGRINRLTTEYSKLFYYTLVSRYWLDTAIVNALIEKRDFNDREIYSINKENRYGFNEDEKI